MTKPDDVPQDVWDKAGDYADELHVVTDYMFLESRKVIARAIMAAKAEEREACATLAFAFNEDVPEHFSAMPFSLDAAAGWLSARIASAIRKRGETD